MGLLNNKHIPPLYFRASYQQRLALLQGLLDTDGTIHIDQGRIEFSVCNERLAWDFVELATTLGFKPMLTEGDAKIQGRTVGKRYRVGMTAYNDMLVFQLPRKSARLKARPRTASLSSGRMIVACEPVASEPVKCIKVANPSGLFLAGKGMIPTHNTPVGGGIGLYGFLADNEPSAEIYSAATGREQASICFKDAKRMVEASPALQKRVDINVGNLAVLGTNSYFRPVSSEHKGLDGKRVHMAIIDELHEHPDSIVVDKMRAGTKRRQNALIFEITNSGFDRNTVCWQHHDLSLKILQGIIENDAWFAYVATLDPCEACAAEGRTDPNPECQHCDDWRDESTWLKANPGLDTILPRQYLREQVAEAIAMPSKENIVRRLNFCIWTKSKTRWLSMTKWDECNRGPITLDSLRGRPCYAGLDLASTIDIAALVLLFPPISEDEDWYTVLPYFFVPEEHPRAKSDKEIFTYIQWIKQGSMIATEGDVIDYDAIRACIAGPQVLQSFAPGAVETYTGSLKKWRIPEEGLASWFDIKAVVKDRWGSVGIGTQLQGDGLTVVDYGQGFASMTAPARALEGIVQERRLHHGGHPVLRWMASNTMVRTDPAGNIKPDKGKSTEKIDGIVALLMALGVSDKTPLEEPPIYETRGAISIKLPRTRYD
jgi:phage terminase large subunit-like protein